MTNFTNLPKTITAAIGAVFISTLFVVATVGPVVPAAASATASASVQANA
jgi:hypothetical protein